MSSFHRPHHLYLFAMKNGKKKLAYGPTPQEAYEILKLRLSEKELRAIQSDRYQRITQRELPAHVPELG